MKNTFFLMLAALLAGCALYPISPAGLETAQSNTLREPEEMARRYPYWNVSFGSFIADKEDLNAGIIPNSELLDQYQKITALDKRLMLQKLDIIRFVVNTPEFESNMMKRTFAASGDASGPKGTMKAGQPLDNKRYLEIVRKRSYPVTIRKKQIDTGAAAVGVVGVPLYVLADNDRQISNAYWIAFPNREIWSKGGYLQETYMAGVVFHEMLHNTGFGHIADNDPVYGLQDVFLLTYNDRTFRKKYEKEISAFRGYYEAVYREWLIADTVPGSSKSRSVEPAIPSGGVICILNGDGTHTMQTNP